MTVQQLLRAKHDIVYFAETFFKIQKAPKWGWGPIKLYNWQKDALHSWQIYDRSNTIASRQIGSSIIEMIFAFHRALFNDDHHVLIVCNRQHQCQHIIQNGSHIYQEISQFNPIIKRNSNVIYFNNGSSITALSSSGPVLGRTVNTVILDNIDFHHRSEAVFHSIPPQLSLDNSFRMVVCGTPKDRKAIQYSLKDSRMWNTRFFDWTVIPDRDDRWVKHMRDLLGISDGQQAETFFNSEFECLQ